MIAGTHLYTWVQRETTQRQWPDRKSNALTTRPPRLHELHQVARRNSFVAHISVLFIHKCWKSVELIRLGRKGDVSVSFRKVQIFHFVSFHFVSQSTDFSFRFVPFRFAKYRFFISFRSISFRPISFRPISFLSISFRKVQCFAFVNHSIYCHCLLSLAVRYIIRYSTIKSLGKLVEVTCCWIKVKRKFMVDSVTDSPRLSSRFKYVVQTLTTIRSTLVIVCMS